MVYSCMALIYLYVVGIYYCYFNGSKEESDSFYPMGIKCDNFYVNMFCIVCMFVTTL